MEGGDSKIKKKNQRKNEKNCLICKFNPVSWFFIRDICDTDSVPSTGGKWDRKGTNYIEDGTRNLEGS